MFDFLTNIIMYSLLFSMNISLNGEYYLDAMQKNVDSPAIINNNSLGIDISAPYAVVLDKKSKKVLFEKNKKLQTPIASVTKLMTALVFLNHNPGWETKLKIEPSDFRPGNHALLRAGDEVTVQDLFYLTLIPSSNEASMALVRSTGMSMNAFIEEMNSLAKKFRLEYTYFIDPTGLEPANISTAYEISLLADRAFQQKDIIHVVQKKEYEFQVLNTKRRVIAKSTDKLLDSFINNKENNYVIVGAKTGYIDESLYNFVAEVRRDNHSIILAIFGSKTSDDRWIDAKGLSEWAFSNFRWKNE